MLVEYCLRKELCVSKTWFRREKKKMRLRMRENVTEIDLVLIRKVHLGFLRTVKAIHGEFQQALVVAGVDKKKQRMRSGR